MDLSFFSMENGPNKKLLKREGAVDPRDPYYFQKGTLGILSFPKKGLRDPYRFQKETLEIPTISKQEPWGPYCFQKGSLGIPTISKKEP